MRKRLVAAVTLGLLASALVIQAPAAHAANVETFAGAAECKVTLQFPNPAGGAATCNGTIGPIGVGASVNTGTNPPSATTTVCVTVAKPCTFTANVAAYTEPCPIPSLPLVPPLVGTANGTFTVSDGTNSSTFGFTWVRVGLTAVLVPALGGQSAGVAAFVPTPPLGTCQAPLPLTAEVVGVAAGVK